ncbi:MAG: hypothetical protein LQ339_004739 [Xanthoria mediterranea]|nr:MAG: hypothetical protein LQ339_004739 [Xanthoria mediterranea]
MHLNDAQESQPQQSQSLAFQNAVNEVHRLKARPTNEEMLESYMPYTSKGKAKIDAWEKIVDEGVTTEQAQETYAVLVDDLKVKYGFDTR